MYALPIKREGRASILLSIIYYQRGPSASVVRPLSFSPPLLPRAFRFRHTLFPSSPQQNRQSRQKKTPIPSTIMKFTFTSMTMPCAIGLVVALLPDNSAFLKTAMSDTVAPVVQVLPSQNSTNNATMSPNETVGSAVCRPITYICVDYRTARGGGLLSYVSVSTEV